MTKGKTGARLKKGRTSLLALSFPLLLERARERRFKKPTMIYQQYNLNLEL
jgi:hypothetical protein